MILAAERAMLRVRLTPRADRNELTRFAEGVLYARVSAPPAGGAANRALVSLLSAALDLRRTAIVIVGGATGRDKLVAVDDVHEAELISRLTSLFSR